MTMIHIADKQTDELLGFIHADDFWASVRERQLKDNVDTFDFETFATEPFSAKLEDRNRILIQERTGGYAEFIIDESIQLMDSSGFHFKSVFTNASFLELRKQKLISPQTTNNMSPEDHVAFALAGTEWEVGNVDYGQNHTTVLTEYMNAYDYLRNTARWSGMELRFRVEHNGTRVTGRYVDLVEVAGEWRGFEAVFGENLLEIERRRKYDNIVTALLGVGPDNDDGSPRVEVLVEDDTALQMWGRKGAHYIEVFEPQSEDQNINPEKLEELTRAELSLRISHQTEYVATVASLAEVIGTDPNRLQFGDIVRVKDEMFNPPLYLEARVHSIKEDIKEYGDSEVVLGDFIEFSEEDVKDALKRMQDAIDSKVGNAELVEAIENVAELKRVVQPTPPTDTRVLWIDNSDKPYIAKVYVDAVEGWVKMSHTTAEEVGADPEGSADAALQIARGEISDVVDTLDAFQNDYNNFVSDGFVSRAEALSIERHLAELSAEKKHVDSEYTATYSHPELTGAAKTNLQTAKTGYNNAHAALITAINDAIVDGYINATEKTAVSNAFVDYENALGEYATKRSEAFTFISFNQSETVREDLNEDILAVAADLSNLQDTINDTFKDGIIEEAEAKAIEKYLNSLTSEKEDLDQRYNTTYNDDRLIGAPQTNLGSAKNAYNTAHANLIASINSAIADGKTTTTEKSDVDAKFATYTSALGALSSALAVADEAIIEQKDADVTATAEELAATAQSAAELYAQAEAENARIAAEAFADGIITDEEHARMEEAQQILQDAKEYAEQTARDAVEAIDNSDLATKEELDAAKERLEEQISSRLGVNALRNSIGYAQLDFWQFTTASMAVTTIMDEPLSDLGFGSGFFFPADGVAKGIRQTVNVVAGEEYTLSWYLSKASAGSFTIDILDGTTVLETVTDITPVGAGYGGNFVTFTPPSNSITVRFTAAGTVEATLTGNMLSLGNLPVPWTLASGELYNAVVRADERGLVVMRLDENGDVEGYTNMSPQEFAGYYDENRDGNFERVFWLNEDETVTKKLRALEEITMGTLKITRIESAQNRGWAIAPIVPEE